MAGRPLIERTLATLVTGEVAAGTHTYEWDASDLASGIYLARLETAQGSTSLRLMLVK